MGKAKTLEEATKFLTDDFLWAVKRTQRLYVTFAQRLGQWTKEWKPDRVYGFFEPALLCLSWCDYLGALYRGGGKSRERSLCWLRSDPMTSQNSRYRDVAEHLYVVHRCGFVHGYYPATFDLNYKDSGRSDHLSLTSSERMDVLEVHIPSLIEDLIGAIECYAKEIGSKPCGEGSLEAFNAGVAHVERHALQDYQKLKKQ